MKQYKVVNGTSFDANTSDQVINVLTRVMNDRTRIRVHYGDIATGLDWMERYDITGYVGRSNGINKIPLLVYNTRSTGGGGILDHCIVKIETSLSHCVLYQHPNYHTPNE